MAADSQLTYLSKGSCQGCVARDMCGAQDTECYPFRVYPNEVLGPDHPGLLSWIAEVRGLEFNDVVARSAQAIQLPHYVPQVAARGIRYVEAGNCEFVAVTLGGLFSNPLLRPVGGGDIRHVLGLPQTSKVILLSIGRDALIERMWGRQHEVYRSIAAFRFDLATGFNYSVWYNEPRLEHLVNLKRSLLTFERLQHLGVPVVPHVYWYDRLDLRRWAEWLSRNEVSMVAVNLQTARKDSVWEHVIEGVRWMGEHFPRELRYLVIGPTTAERINAIRASLGQVAFCNKDPYMLAIRRRYKTWSGTEFGKAQWDAEPATLFRHNVAVMSQVAAGLPPAPFSLVDGIRGAVMEQLLLPGMPSGDQEYVKQLALAPSADAI